MRKSVKKYWWGTLWTALSFLTYLKVGVPQDVDGTVNFLVSVDQFIINNARYPGLFIVSVSILFGTVIVPWVIEFINHHVAIKKLWALRESGSDYRNRAFNVKSDLDYAIWKSTYETWRIDVLKEAKKVSFHLWNWLNIMNVMDGSKMPILDPGYANQEFLLNYAIACETLNRLERYLTRELILPA
jgi:hypothetical protein